MGDFDFGFTEGPRRRDSSGFRVADDSSYGDMNYHKERQGFQRPFDRSPVDVPAGWYGGRAENTGGHVIVRSWDTIGDKGIGFVHDTMPGRQREYQISYGMEPGVHLEKYEWSGSGDGGGAYYYSGIVDQRHVRENTDQAKARAALELMKKHSGRTR